MKYFSIFAMLIAIILFGFSTQPVDIDASGVLTKTLNKLNSLKSISYTYKRVLDYPGEGYHNEIQVNSYLDFNPTSQFIGLKYQFDNNDMLTVYNGSETFSCNKKEKAITVNNSPDLNQFRNSSYLFNSPVTLKNALPGIIADPSIPKRLYDTIINKQDFYTVDITLTNETLNALGDYAKTTKDLKFSYKLIIDKTTLMPVAVLEHTLNNKDTSTTFFTNINFAPVERPDPSWYSSSYDNYTLQKPKEKIDLIKPDTQAPDSHLTYFVNHKSTSINEYKGKVVLLEFWIKDCGPCIENVPLLNALNTKYKSANFKLLAVNSHDTKSMIDVFLNKHTVKYDIVTGGKEIDKDYGIWGFPQLVLLDKKGIVIYSGGLDQKKLETLIDQNI